MKGFFITGTDTGVGKTCITAGLTHLTAQHGLRTAAIKSLAAGQDWVDGRWLNDDVALLQQASNMPLTEAEVCPLQLHDACAPHIAAQKQGVAIEREKILSAIRATGSRADVAMVEGAGGFRVPLLPGWDMADLCADLQLPVVLVVGMRLGCLSHALLTAESIRARGLKLAGWVANILDPQILYLEDNLNTLADSRLGLQVPLWGTIPPLHPVSPAAVASHLNHDLVLQALAG
jgi:dethiobiotin synthetase